MNVCSGKKVTVKDKLVTSQGTLLVSQERGGKMNPDASDVPTPLPLGVKWKQIGFSLPKARESSRLCLLLALNCSYDWPPRAHLAYESGRQAEFPKTSPRDPAAWC